MKDKDFFSKKSENTIKKNKRIQIRDMNSFCMKKNFLINGFNLTHRIILIFKLVIFFHLFISISAKDNNFCQLKSYYSYITVTINQKGEQSFLYDQFNYCPDEVYVNENLISPKICNRIVLNETTNKIKIAWINELIDTNNMFNNLLNIISIDLSHFNSSLVTSMNSMFSGCKDLKSIVFTNINTSLVTSMDYMFKDCISLTTMNLKLLKTSQVTSMKSMFYNCRKSYDFSKFDTSSVQYMDSMFYNCSINTITLKYFDTSNVISMKEMFCCGKFTSLNLSNFNTSNVITMSNMFNMCTKLKIIDISHFNTSKVTTMEGMFKSCSVLSSLNIKNYDTSQVNLMNSMFSGCSVLTSLDISSFNTCNVNKMNYMFKDCKKIKSLDLSNFDTSSVQTMAGMFENCEALNNTLNLSNFNTSRLEDMKNMFSGCKQLKVLDVSSFVTSNVSNMSHLFENCMNLAQINILNFDTSKVKSMHYMFYYCKILTSLNISFFNTSLVDNMNHMFYNCQSLTSLNLDSFNTSSVKDMNYMFYNLILTSLNLSSFDTSSVTNMNSMFYNCKLIDTFNLSHFNTKSLQTMNSMFYGCESLVSLNLSNFDTSLVTTMNYLFKNCKNLISLDINNFDTSLVETMSYMFSGCEKFEYINLSIFNTSLVKDISEMFSGCTSLISLNLSEIDTSSITKIKSLFSGCINLVTLDIGNLNTSDIKDMSSFFYNCSSIKFLNLSYLNTSSMTTMSSMFYSCTSLTSIVLSNFNTSSVKSMRSMFENCILLKSLDLSKFDTSSVTTMEKMFQNCINLSSIYISNFDTSSVSVFSSMFNGCSSLEFLNLSNFQTPKGKNMNQMFNGCTELTSLIINNFNTSSVTNMEYMFGSCSSLIELDLSNFQLSSVQTMSYMFKGCEKLEYINLNNSIENKNGFKLIELFESVPINLVICINKNNTNIMSYISNLSCAIIDCSNDWEKNKKIIILGEEQCSDSCNEITYNNEINHTNICCEYCKKVNNSNDNNLYETKEISHQISDKSEIIKTTKITEMTELIKKTETIVITEIIGTAKITEIKIDSETINYSSDILNNLNIKTNYENQYNSNTKYYSSSDIFYNYNELFYDYSNLFIGFNNTEIFEKINKLIKDYSIYDEKNIIIKGESGFIYQITTTDLEKDLLTKNITRMGYDISIIDFTECEQLLKQENNINENDSLIILKMEKITNKTSEKNIQLQIYEPTNITLLDISICKNLEMKVHIPFSLEGETLSLYQDLQNYGYDLFDINDKFYNDICTPYTSNSGTDVILSGRQKYFYSEYGNLCQDNCNYLNYSTNIELISCSCKMDDTGIEPNNEEKFNPKILYQSFYDILKFSNYKTMKCTDLIFDNKLFSSNKGNIIVIVYFAIYSSFFVLFLIKGISSLKIICSKFELNLENNPAEIKPQENIIKSINEKNDNVKNSIGNKKIVKIIKKIKKKKKTKIYSKDNPPLKKLKLDNLNTNQNNTRNKNKSNISKVNHSSLRHVLELKNINEKDISVYSPKNDGIIDIKEKNHNNDLSSYQLNNLEYEDSLKLDNRKFHPIYWSILKREHIILFTFFTRNDYNLVSIKFTRFIFLICTDMALNVFFFSDESMDKIFLSYGKYDFIQKIPQMVYTILVSQLIEVLLCFLSLTDKYLYQIKKLKDKTLSNYNKIFRIVKIKLSLFFLVTFILFIFYWYIISAFCAVYKNTQIIFIKDSIISFMTGLIYPFVLYLIPSGLRIICLKHKERNLKFLYALSDIIPIF